MSRWSEELLEYAEAAMSFKRAGFVVRPKDITKNNVKEMMFYVDCPSWRKYSVHATFTNLEAADRYITDMEAQYTGLAKMHAIQWC